MSINVELTRVVAATLTANGNATAGHHTPVDATSGAVTVTLPAVSAANVGAKLSVEKIDTSANAVTVSGSIRGSASTLTLTTKGAAVELLADSAGSWWPIHSPLVQSITAADSSVVVGGTSGAPTVKVGDLSATYVPQGGGLFPVQLYGTVDTTGATASDTAVLAAVTAWRNSSNGGTILFPAGTIRCDAQLLIPNDGASPPRQKFLSIKGLGTFAEGSGGGVALDPAGGTILDLRYPGRVDTATVTSGSNVVSDATITAADFGLPVFGTGIPENTFIGTVTPGVSFLLSSASGSQVNVNATANGTSVTVGYAKIDTRGFGALHFEDITLTDLGTSSNRFVFTSNTRVTVKPGTVAVIGNPSKSGTACDQDAFVLGGTNGPSSPDWDTTPNGPFQGYGSFVKGVFFNRIRRGALLQTYCNGALVQDNTIWQQCGSNDTVAGAPFEINGTPNPGASVGNIISGNTVEMGGYVYGSKVQNGVNNVLGPNGFYDQGGSTLACYRFDAYGRQNLVIDGYRSGSLSIKSEDTSQTGGVGTNSTLSPLDNGTMFGTSVQFDNNARIVAATGSAAGALVFRQGTQDQYQWYQAPGSALLYLRDLVNGLMLVTVHPGATGGISFGTWIASSSWIKPQAVATASRPSAATADVGAMIYDSTLSKPVWSDGTTWRDATGAAV